jgi:hypothetical protein
VIDIDSFTACLGIAARTDVIAPMPLYIVDRDRRDSRCRILDTG